jgi:2-polyprenyl-6-hydroxyphenyl methylase/3-demethylubiquinone-9 3-methyltransferase
MPGLPAQAANLTLPCKCCGNEARLFDVVDFNRNCDATNRRVLPLSGVPIYYHRCETCGFIFTSAFDHFTFDDFRTLIYNADYVRVDPEYLDIRPQRSVDQLTVIFGANPDFRILDYGGGDGTTAARLKESVFKNVEIYDPFVKGFDRRPTGKFDMVHAVEVVEHSTRPREIFEEMNSFLSPDGLIYFSTTLVPPKILEVGAAWWYFGPRNGHVSFYTHAAIAHLTGHMGLCMGSFTQNVHMLYKGKLPKFASHLTQRG